VAFIERAGAECVAQLRGELRIRAEARIEFTIDFADDARARIFRDAFGEQALDLRFDRGDDAFDGGGVGGVEEGELGFRLRSRIARAPGLRFQVAQASFPWAACWRTPVLLEALRTHVLNRRRWFALHGLATRRLRDLAWRWRGRVRRGLRDGARRRARPCG
jgi:hypothetical protein